MERHLFELAITIKNQQNIITLDDTDEMFWFSEKKIYTPAETRLKTYIQEQVGSEVSTHKANEVLNTIRRATYEQRTVFNPPLNLIPLENKIFDFETETLIDYGPEHKFLAKHPIQLTEIPEETTNPISEWLTTITDKQENEVMLKELMGYCFYRAMPFQNFFLLVGSGANGKSVYLNILQEMLGRQNVSGISLQQLADHNNRFITGELYLKNANIFGDLSPTGMKDVGRLKELTGDDVITSDRKFKGVFSFRNYSKIIASCNAIPETPEFSDAFFRRPIIINFPYSFEGKEDRTLFQKLATPENMSLFFLDSIRAFKEAISNNKLIRNESIEEKKKLYLHYSNSARAFIELKLEYDPDSELETQEIYLKYKEFCKAEKLVVRDERWFFIDLYRAFGNRVYKKRRETIGIRSYVICGLFWK